MEPEQTALELLPALQRVDMPPPALERIAEAFISIGANRDFAGTADLARRLAERLRLADRMELPGEDARRGLINPLEVLGRLEGNPRAPLLRLPPGGQPAGPKATYPIIRCLLSIPSPALRGRIERLQAILVAAALLYPDGEHPPILGQAAATVRLAASGLGARASALLSLDVLDREPIDLQDLAKWAREQHANSGLSTTAREFGRSLANLLATFISRSASFARPAVLWEPISPDGGIDAFDGELIEVVELPVATVPGDLDAQDEYSVSAGEDLEHVFAWLEDTSRIRAPTSPQGRQARARASAYWLPIYRRALPWDRRVLAPPQRWLILERVRSAPTFEPGTTQHWPALVCALLLATGLNLDEIAALQIGAGETLDPLTGIYRRVPPGMSPGGAASPGHVHALPMGSVLELPLPEAARALLPKTDRQSVGDWLAQRDADWRNALGAWLSDLSPGEPLPPTPERVARCLPFALVQLKGDLALTHLLAGMRTHRPPIELTYSAYSIAVLINAYRTAVGSVFSDDGLAGTPNA